VWEEAKWAGVGREVRGGKLPSKKGSQVSIVESLSPPSAAKKYIIYEGCLVLSIRRLLSFLLF